MGKHVLVAIYHGPESVVGTWTYRWRSESLSLLRTSGICYSQLRPVPTSASPPSMAVPSGAQARNLGSSLFLPTYIQPFRKFWWFYLKIPNIWSPLTTSMLSSWLLKEPPIWAPCFNPYLHNLKPRVTLLQCKSYYVIPLFKAFNSLPSRSKSKIQRMAHRALMI